MKRIRRRRRRIRRADSEQRGDGDDGGALGNGGRTNRVTTKGTPKENGKCDKTAYFTASNGECKYCHIECNELGCGGPSESDCFGCKNLRFYDSCLTECPFGYKAENPNEDNRCYMATSIMVAIITASILLTWFVISTLSRCYYRNKYRKTTAASTSAGSRQPRGRSDTLSDRERERLGVGDGEPKAFLEGYLLSSNPDAPYLPANKKQPMSPRTQADFSPSTSLRMKALHSQTSNGGSKRDLANLNVTPEKLGNGSMFQFPAVSVSNQRGEYYAMTSSNSPSDTSGEIVEPHLISTSSHTSLRHGSGSPQGQNVYDINYLSDNLGSPSPSNETKLGVVFMKRNAQPNNAQYDPNNKIVST